MKEFDRDKYINQGGLYIDDGCIWYEGIKHLPERTCHLIETDDRDGYGRSYGKSIRCSSCNKPLKKNLVKEWSGIQFCYRCGAKVVG